MTPRLLLSLVRRIGCTPAQDFKSPQAKNQSQEFCQCGPWVCSTCTSMFCDIKVSGWVSCRN